MIVKRWVVVLTLLVAMLAGSVAWAAKPGPKGATTTRDDKGVWSIQADNIKDAFDAMGYAVATDRLWQTELYFRSATGRLAEIFGPSQLSTDMFMRTIGYTKKEYKKGFKSLSPDAQDVLTGFVDGFNRRVDEVNNNPALMPFEYLALSQQTGMDIQPQHWTVYDVMAWLVLLQREFDPEALNTGQLDNYQLYWGMYQYFPQDYQAMFHDLRWVNDPQALTYIPPPAGAAPVKQMSRAQEMNALARQFSELPPGTEKAVKQTSDIIHSVIDNLKKINAYVHMGSYAWVVSGSKTADGNPIIYSGPQMGFSVPSITCEGAIKTPTLNISGMTVPGIPLIIIGRTPHHAWSMQVGHAHTTDYYLENPLAMKKDHVEKIQVAGQGTVKVKIYRSRHGPVISPMPFDPKHVDGPVITWANSHWDHEWEALDGFLQMARATSMDQFDAGIHKVCVSQHFCYADKDGNIAYWMSGWDPVRAPGDVTMLPQPSDGMHEWTGQLKPLSTDRNNAQGYYCGWNNKSNINYDNAPNNLSYSFGPFDRAHVINDYISTHNDLTFDQIRDLAINIATTDSSVGTGGVPWSQCGSYFTAAVEAYPSNPNYAARMAAVSLIQSWDGHFVAGGPSQWVAGTSRADAWVLEEAWIDNVIKLTFSDELGPDMAKPSMQLFNVLLHALKGQSSGVVNYYNWFKDDAGLGLPTDPQQLIDLALDMTLQDIGLPPYNQPRGVITYTDDFLGAIHTMPYSNRSTYGHCVEYGPSGVVRLESFFPLGESGFIGLDATGTPTFDPNFFSMAPLFDTFTMRPFPAPTN